MKLAPKEMILLYRLKAMRRLEPATKWQLARALDGSPRAKTWTMEFVNKLIINGFLRDVRTDRVKVGNTFKDRTIFDRDSEAIKALWNLLRVDWAKTDEYKLSHLIIEEEATII